MRTFMFILAVGTGLAWSAAQAVDTFPTFNIQSNCKAELGGGSNDVETLKSCVNDEQRAKDELTKNWARFQQADKTARIRETSIDGTPSYVELQTCLELAADVRANRGQGK